MEHLLLLIGGVGSALASSANSPCQKSLPSIPLADVHATRLGILVTRNSAVALAAAVAGDPGAIAAATDAGVLPTDLAEAIAQAPVPLAPPAAAIHPRATLDSIAGAARYAAGTSGKSGKYRIAKKRSQPYGRAAASSSDDVTSA